MIKSNLNFEILTLFYHLIIKLEIFYMNILNYVNDPYDYQLFKKNE